MPLFFDAFTRFGRRMNQHKAHPWSLDHLVGELDHCSISGALVADTRCVFNDAMHQNLKLVEQLEPYDYLFPIWNVHPHWAGDFPEPGQLTKLMLKHDVRAVTIHPKLNGWQALSPTSEPLLRELERTATLTIVEMPAELSETQLEEFLEKYPNLPLLLHKSWWTWQRTLLPLVLRHKNLHLGFTEFQMSYGPEFLVERGCEDQLVFCTNAPTSAAGGHRAYVDYADIPAAAKEKFASGNLIRLLKGLRPPRERLNSNEDPIMRAARLGQPVPCLAVDAHCHILDEGLHGGGGSFVMHNGGPKGVWRMAQRMGVRAMGFMSWSGVVGIDSDDGNRTTRQALDALPDACWGLGSFDPLIETPEQARRKIRALFADRRFIGFKPYPLFNVHYDRPEFEPWWEYAEQRHLYALIHVCRDDFSELDALCPRYPNVTWLAAHCGSSYDFADRAIARAKKFPNFLAEVTLTPTHCGMIDYLVAGCGADCVLYGTDLPMRDPRVQFGWVVYSRLSLEDKKKVLGLNAQKMVGRIRTFNQIPDPLAAM